MKVSEFFSELRFLIGDTSKTKYSDYDLINLLNTILAMTEDGYYITKAPKVSLMTDEIGTSTTVDDVTTITPLPLSVLEIIKLAMMQAAVDLKSLPTVRQLVRSETVNIMSRLSETEIERPMPFTI